jgi:hypothetical protein
MQRAAAQLILCILRGVEQLEAERARLPPGDESDAE